MSKKAAQMIEGINHCQNRMDSNFDLIKRYFLEGKKPNTEFKKLMLTLSDEFIRVANLKFHKENA